MDRAAKRNQNLMHLIKRVHGIVENPDIEKHRQSQDTLGSILGNTRDIHYRELNIGGLYAEWVGVNRAHMKKYVILHCHGGGYSTGSSLYARTLTSKLAESTSMDVLCFDYRLAPGASLSGSNRGCHEGMGLSDVTRVWGKGYYSHRGFCGRKSGTFPCAEIKGTGQASAKGNCADVTLDRFDQQRKVF